MFSYPLTEFGMRRFKVFLLVISTVFIVASCGSSTTSTDAIEGIGMASKVKVL
jgi:hypothetical protein